MVPGPLKTSFHPTNKEVPDRELGNKFKPVKQVEVLEKGGSASLG